MISVYHHQDHNVKGSYQEGCDDIMIMESTGAREIVETGESYKISLYFPILDAIISELRNRFDNKYLDLMRAIKCCNPSSSQFLESDCLLPLIES